MGWLRTLAEKVIPEYNPKTDWWMRGGTAPHTPWQRTQPTPPDPTVTVITQEEDVDHEKARMNEAQDQEGETQDRKAMDIPKPSAGAPWRQAQEMAHEPETEAPARSIDPA
jgi:hypothetical protein